MIQRLQSLYLAAAAALLVGFVVLAEAWQALLPEAYAWLGAVGVTLSVATAVVALGAIFFYKDRALQRKVTLAAQWLDVLLVVVVVAGVLAAGTGALTTAGAVAVTAVLLPLLAYVLLRLARRGVEKDIALVRSMDRLR